MVVKPIYEFLLWDNCNNNCSFCPQRKNPNNLSLEQQCITINEVMKFIDSPKFKVNNHILLAGGEIMDNVDLFNPLTHLFEFITNKMKSNYIDLLYVNTNLLYEDTIVLRSLLDYIVEYKLEDRFRFTTSFDIEGRFHTPQKLDTFLKNILMMKNDYPTINVVVNMIITKQFCDAIEDKVFDVEQFMKDNNVKVMLLPYIEYNPELTTDRNRIIDMLFHMEDIQIGYINEYMYQMDLPQERILHKFINNEFTECSCKIMDCGHSENFTKWNDGGSCYVCDLKEIFNG